jgi:hypothetical protein
MSVANRVFLMGLVFAMALLAWAAGHWGQR